MYRPSLSLAGVIALAGCLGVGPGALSPVYPPRPAAAPGEPLADPAPSRVTTHLTVTAAGLRDALEDAVPRSGEGTFPLVGSARRFTWTREPIALRFTQGRVALDLDVLAQADLPLHAVELPMKLSILAEPVISSEYLARLQSVEVSVRSDAALVRVAQAAAGVLDKVKKQVEDQLTGFSYSLRPLIGGAYDRISRPLDLPLGEAHGCATLRVLGVEAGPTVLADGIEKDLALIVAPSVTLPCAADPTPAPLPPLANVASLPTGPFTVEVPIAATYDELARTMGLVFTDGKLFFSTDFPGLYLEKPEVYAARDQLVLKLHLAGPVHKLGLDSVLDGDLFMSGNPSVEDNELRVPNLEPTIETHSFLLALKAAVDGDRIRDQARAALRLDLGQRLAAVRAKLSTDLSFAGDKGCVRAQVHRIQVTGVHVHAAYLRLDVAATGSASVYLPCPSP